MQEISRYIISEKATVRQALERLNDLSGGAMTLFVADACCRFTGAVTDGDVRRYLIGGGSLSDPLTKAMHRPFAALAPGELSPEAFAELRRRHITLVPVIDADGRPVRLIDLHKTLSVLPLSALIMAGGRGERLRPLTDSRPKPLIDVAGRPIIDYTLDTLAAAGIDDIAVSVRYLAGLIEAHISSTRKGIRCIREDKPLGTVGALPFAGPFRHPDVLVMNSDLLTDISLEDMFIHHRDTDADITVATFPYSVAVPYAILDTDDEGNVTALREKPVYTRQANAGIYIVGPRAIALIEPGEHLDTTDLIERSIAAGLTVKNFPFNGIWIDVGTPADLRRADEIMKYHNRNT